MCDLREGMGDHTFYGRRTGVTQRAVIKRRDRILRDLKKYFENFLMEHGDDSDIQCGL